MSDTKSRASSYRLEPRVQNAVDGICAAEYRNVSNAVNLLVIEALTARGLWHPPTTTEPTPRELT